MVRNKKNKSPCIDICDFSGPHGWCVGCGRTRGECDKKKKLRPYDIQMIKKQLKRRLALIAIEID